MCLDANQVQSMILKEPVFFFQFSKDTVRVEELINTISISNFKVSGKTRVCIKHLDDKDIKEDSNVEWGSR